MVHFLNSLLALALWTRASLISKALGVLPFVMIFESKTAIHLTALYVRSMHDKTLLKDSFSFFRKKSFKHHEHLPPPSGILSSLLQKQRLGYTNHISFPIMTGNLYLSRLHNNRGMCAITSFVFSRKSHYGRTLHYIACQFQRLQAFCLRRFKTQGLCVR